MKAFAKFKKTIKVIVKDNVKGVVLKYPKQSIGTVWLESVNGVVVGQWALIISKNSVLAVEKL